ncbi:MAG: SAM-dependent chlorinase/fluorinase, partial [Thermosynechococcaceae cyanobacterium]
SQYWHNSTPSQTFHGRDIFAPVAAHLASGIPFADLGDPIDPHSLVKTLVPEHQRLPHGLRGTIQAIDGFGNAITNIPGSAIQGPSWSVVANDQIFPGQLAYSDVSWGNPVSVLGSHGWIELAIYGGSVAQQMDLGIGASVELTWGSVSFNDLP